MTLAKVGEAVKTELGVGVFIGSGTYVEVACCHNIEHGLYVVKLPDGRLWIEDYPPHMVAPEGDA